jgi:hypothetical protein
MLIPEDLSRIIKKVGDQEEMKIYLYSGNIRVARYSRDRIHHFFLTLIKPVAKCND